MFIAQKLKKENISEYLLYMWQIEDLIRAYKLDIDCINKNIIQPYPVSNQERKILYDWYESLIEMMRIENVQNNGHLQLNKNTCNELNELHENILKSGCNAAYSAKYYHVLPFLSQFRNQNNSTENDVELSFNFQYGIMLLRLKKVTISTLTLQAQTEICKFLGLLSRNYLLYKSGELTFED